MNPNPIVLHTFSKGGSNLIWNIFQSHPNVVSPGGEIHETFTDVWGRVRSLLATRSRDYWHINNTNPRQRASVRFDRFVKGRLYEAQLKTLTDEPNAWITQDRKYSEAEVKSARLALKCHNGQVFLTEQLRSTFDEPYFVAMPRDAFSLCEAYLRRGHFSSAEIFANHYKMVVDKMISDSKRVWNYQIVRYEDLFGPKFHTTLESMFSACNLDATALNGMVRLKAKELEGDEAKSLQDHWSGSTVERNVSPGAKYWIPISDIGSFVDFDVNQRQADSLDSDSRRTVERICGSTLEELGYL